MLRTSEIEFFVHLSMMLLQRISITILIIFLMIEYVTTCGRRLVQHRTLLINGFESNQGDFPWHAALYHIKHANLEYKCGGTVLNSNSILTAAHCVYDEFDRLIVPERILVHLGKHHLFISGSHMQDFQVRKVIPHPRYIASNVSNDIAILRLATEATFNNYVQPICLWDSNNVDISQVIGKFGTVAGYGLTETGEVSYILRKTVMPIVSFSTCLSSNRDFFGSFLSDKTFCAGFRNGTCACAGDSGGSLTIEENGVHSIRGIVSLGVGTQNNSICNSTEYVLFTDVAKYLSWIEEEAFSLRSSVKSEKQGRLTFQHSSLLGVQLDEGAYCGSVVDQTTSPSINFQLSGNIWWSKNCDYHGGDFSFQQSRVEDCGEICSNNEKCTHFTWRLIDGGRCDLKKCRANSTASVKLDEDAYCGLVVDRTARSTLHFELSGNIMWSYNCDYVGGDFETKQSRAEDCAGICSNNEKCTHFTWISTNGGRCHLKEWRSDAVVSIKLDEDAVCGWIFGRITSARWSIEFKLSENIWWSKNCDYHGGDFATHYSRVEDCGGICSNNEKCTHFSWRLKNGGICYLKKWSTNTTVSVKLDGHTHCGWILGRTPIVMNNVDLSI